MKVGWRSGGGSGEGRVKVGWRLSAWRPHMRNSAGIHLPQPSGVQRSGDATPTDLCSGGSGVRQGSRAVRSDISASSALVIGTEPSHTWVGVGARVWRCVGVRVCVGVWVCVGMGVRVWVCGCGRG